MRRAFATFLLGALAQWLYGPVTRGTDQAAVCFTTVTTNSGINNNNTTSA
jgi:hypothetical protein